MRYRPSELVPREQRAPFLSLFIDIAALMLVGGISTTNLWIHFLKPEPESTPVPVAMQRVHPGGRASMELPDLATQMNGLAGLIQQGQHAQVAAPLLGAILTELADARARGESPETFLATGFREAGLHTPHTEWVRNCVMMNWSAAHEFGLLTPANLELMRRGDPPLVTIGSFRGDAMEVVMQPVNDPRYRTDAAFPKFVPARMAKSMQLAAQNETAQRPAVAPDRMPAPQRRATQARPIVAPQR